MEIGNNFIKHWKNSGKEKLFVPRSIVKVAEVSEKFIFGKKAGIISGDIIVSVNGIPTKYFDEFKREHVGKQI